MMIVPQIITGIIFEVFTSVCTGNETYLHPAQHRTLVSTTGNTGRLSTQQRHGIGMHSHAVHPSRPHFLFGQRLNKRYTCTSNISRNTGRVTAAFEAPRHLGFGG